MKTKKIKIYQADHFPHGTYWWDTVTFEEGSTPGSNIAYSEEFTPTL